MKITTTKATGEKSVRYTSPLTREKALTRAFSAYARRHGYYVRTVRATTSLRLAAMKEVGL